MFLVYTQGFGERFTFIPIQGLLELTILGMILLSYKPVFSPPLNNLLFALAVGLVSAIATSSLIPFLKYIRFVLYFYFLYAILKDIIFTIPQFSKLLKYILGLIVLQGIASVSQSFVLGERIEGYVGLMSSLGGSTATSFPILIISVCMLILIFSNENVNKKVIRWLLICIASVCLLGYSSGKRAIYFIIPITILISFLIARFYYPSYNLGAFKKKVMYGIIGVMLLFPIFIMGISSSRGLNYALRGNESNVEVITKALIYAEQYESAKAGQSSIGRSGSTKNILNQAFSSPEYFFFGSGFGSIKDEGATKKRNIGYGIVGFTRDIFSGGFIFAVLIALWYIYILFYSNIIISDSFFLALRWMLLFAFVFIHFTYASDYTVHLKLTAILTVLLCVVNSSNYSHIKEYYTKYLD